MADVNLTPRIRCDNCGHTEDKRKSFPQSKDWSRPFHWGSIVLDNGRTAGYPEAIKMSDLCPKCAVAAYEAAGKALEKARSEGFDGPTGAE